MAAERFERFQCWRDERIRKVINREAVSVDRAIFLATHTPLSRIRYEKAPQAILDTSEEMLLEEIRSRAANDLHTFMVIQGIPGTGKSHLIRWMKERYAAASAETQQREVIVLIERAYCSLRGTLEQIIRSHMFDSPALQEQLKRLQGAASELSSSGLANTILNNLQVATREVKLPGGGQIDGGIHTSHVEKFLLDYSIREFLKRPNGPIDRIARFLSEGHAAGLGTDELPGFEPDDFALGHEILRDMSDGYREAKMLAMGLKTIPSKRQALASYLNRLLEFTIGRTSALSSSELKQMFNDLRRELRVEGRSLVLFIEDITAFTGVDAGLIDVLATQHTGEGNREFCRLTSVIGITDSYYHDRFPDNMKDRITHRLTLNTNQQGQVEAEFLQTPAAVAHFAARYLNAMRVQQNDLVQWLEDGGRPHNLPNACDSCPHRVPCHASFGSVEVGGQHAEKRVGLYPFNTNALWRMYQGVNTTVTARTPRSLLSSVLEYVLVSHGPKVARGEFPPAPSEMGSEFSPPMLAKPAQVETIDAQGGSDARRVDSLVRFWGDQTVDAVTTPDGRLISGLPEQVFRAFGLSPIDGVHTDKEIPTQPPAKQPGGTSAPEQAAGKTNPAPRVDSGQEEAEPLKTEPDKNIRYFRDIDEWYSGGQRLAYYDTFAGWMEQALLSYIDWEAHGISLHLASDRIKQARLVIEDQVGKVSASDHIHFDRSPELRAALIAMVELSEAQRSLLDAAAGGYIMALRRWLVRQESRVVAFVRQPSGKVPEPQPLIDLLTANVVFLEWLRERLSLEMTNDRALLGHLIKACAVGTAQSTPSATEWGQEIKQAETVRAKPWIQLMRRISVDDIRACQRHLLYTLNRNQGRQPTIRFLDAAAALDAIRKLREQDWKLRALPTGSKGLTALERLPPAWHCAIKMYESLQLYLEPVLNLERDEIRRRIDRLHDLMGNHDAKEVFEAIQTLIHDLGETKTAYQFQLDRGLRPDRLSSCLTELRATLGEESTERLAICLASARERLQELDRYIRHFEDFCSMATSISQQKEQRRAQLESQAGSPGQTLREVESLYESLEQQLAQLAGFVEKREEAA